MGLRPMGRLFPQFLDHRNDAADEEADDRCKYVNAEALGVRRRLANDQGGTLEHWLAQMVYAAVANRLQSGRQPRDLW